MSFILNRIVIVLIGLVLLAGLKISYERKSWAAFILCACLLLRVSLSAIMNQELKYLFVVDSLNYEYKGWLLAQPWMSADLFVSLTPLKSGQFNYYEILISWIFRQFGKDPLMATMFNCLFSTLTILTLWLMHRMFFADQKPSVQTHTQRSGVIYLILLTLYPSYLVWSTTNTRDPLYFLGCAVFFFSFFTAFSKHSQVIFPMRVLALITAALSVWLVLGIRFYVNWLFLIAVVAGLIFYTISRKISWSKLSVIILLGCVIGSFICERLLPMATVDLLRQLAFTRDSFANLKLLDSVSKSSFALDQTFQSMADVWLFLPSALSHYFFGPFIWDVSNLVQMFSLIEAFAIIFLVYPTFLGIRKLYQNAPLETITILTFAITFSVSQSLAISNMGTIYRHRTLSFLFILIFSSEGLNDIIKKNFPSLLKT